MNCELLLATAVANATSRTSYDYLVPSLRDWLTRKQRETRRGRAELKLEERTSAWKARCETKQLPTLIEWLAVRSLTDSMKWTDLQKRMMAKAGWVHGIRCGVSLAILFVGLVGIFAFQRVAEHQKNLVRVQSLVETLVKTDPSQLLEIIQKLDAIQQMAAPHLISYASNSVERRSQLHARLALVLRDGSLVPPLLEELLVNDVRYVGAIRDRLKPYKSQLLDTLWGILRDESVEPKRRFRAAMAIAEYVTRSESTLWTDADLTFIAQQLVVSNAEHQKLIREYFVPMQHLLLSELERIFIDGSATANQQVSAANAIVDYAAQDVRKLVQLLTVATCDQYEILFPLVASTKDEAIKNSLQRIAGETPGEELSQSDRISLGKRRAGAAITLLRQGERELIFDVFRVSSDPESLSQFIARSKSRGVQAKELLDCVEIVESARQKLQGADRRKEDQVLYGLLLTLGDFPLDQIPTTSRSSQIEQLINWYATDPSSAIHGASSWLLRRWKLYAEALQVDQTPLGYDPTGNRNWFTLEIKVDTAKPSLFFTFVVFPAGEYMIGSPEKEYRRSDREVLHRVKLTRPLAVSDRELTWGQYDPIDDGEYHIKLEKQFKRKIGESEPVCAINWYDSVTYSRWLTTQAKFADASQCYEDPATLDQDEKKNPKYEQIYMDRAGFRLLTEAEWEAVCRSGTQTAYSFGNDESLAGDFGWIAATSRERSHAVGELRPGPLGLFDMHGNLSEWCHDLPQNEGYDVEQVNDPMGASKSQFRVNRGSSFYADAWNCRSAGRGRDIPSLYRDTIGVRLALRPPVGQSATILKEKREPKNEK